jgi:hypothetical protein
MAFGAVRLVEQTGWARALATGRWLAGGIVLHDLVLVPLVLGLVWLVDRTTPAWLRPPVATGLLATMLVLALAWPGLRGYGNRPDNPSIHPIDSTTATLSVLAVWWLAMAAWATARLVRSRSRRRPAPGSSAVAPS